MLGNLSLQAIKGQEVQWERDKERSRLYYYLDIAQTLQDKQIKRKQKGKGRTREEREESEEIEAELHQQNQKRSKKEKKGNAGLCREKKGNARVKKATHESKRQKEEEKVQERPKGGGQHTCNLRTGCYRGGRFRVEDMQPN